MSEKSKQQFNLEGVAGLVKPKGMRTMTENALIDVMQHLYIVRVATVRQLSQLVGLRPADLRYKIDRYPYIKAMEKSGVHYVDGAWKHTPRIHYYTLERKTIAQWEELNSFDLYRSQPDVNPIPNVESMNRYILLTELYTSLIKHGAAIEWLPNVLFNKELMERGGVDLQYPLSCGLKTDDQLYGVGLVTSKNGFNNYIRRSFPTEFSSIFNPIFLVKEEVESYALNQSIENFPYIHLIPYEWAVDNPFGFYHWFAGYPAQAIMKVFREYRKMGAVVEFVEKARTLSELNPYKWQIRLPSGEIQFIDTVIGKTVGGIHELATYNRGNNRRIVWVASEAQKDVLESISRKFLANVEYQVIAWPIKEEEEEGYEE